MKGLSVLEVRPEDLRAWDTGCCALQSFWVPGSDWQQAGDPVAHPLYFTVILDKGRVLCPSPRGES